jgi:phosphoglycolate phosphatase
MQLYVEPHEIVPSSYCAAAYLQSIDFNSTVLLVGGEGVAAELEDAGIAYKYCPTSLDPGQWDIASGFKSMEIDHDIGAVVVGFDEQFSYEKICRASAHLREVGGGGRRKRASQDDGVHTNNNTKDNTGGCLFVATNMDNYDNMGNGRMMPGTGCLVAAIERVAGRQAVNVGKGGDWLLPFLLQQYGLKPEETCIVGDRLDTDIALGKVGGLRSVLTLTGVATEEDLRVAGDDEVPDYVVPHLALLAGLEWE